MAATVNARDVLISGQTRTVAITLPSDINVSGTVSGNVTGTLNGTPVTTVVINATNGASHASATGNPHGVTFSQIGDLDDISNGSTYFKTTSTQVTGAGRAYNALDANNEYIKSLTSTKLAVVGSNPSTGWVGDANGIRMYQGGSLKVNIPVSGSPSFSGDVTSAGDIKGEGLNPAADTFFLGGAFYNVDYSIYGRASSPTTSGRVRCGVVGMAAATTSLYDVGVFGKATANLRGYGVVGNGTLAGVYGLSNSFASPGVLAEGVSGGPGLSVIGPMTITSSAVVANLNSNYLSGYQSSQFTHLVVTDSGTATVSGHGFNLNCTVSGVRTRATGSNFVVIESFSDERLKQDIEPEDLGLDFVNALHPVVYRKKSDPAIRYHGFISQHMGTLLNREDDALYQVHSDGTLGTDYLAMIAPIVKSIQQLSSRQVAVEQFLNAQLNFNPQ